MAESFEGNAGNLIKIQFTRPEVSYYIKVNQKAFCWLTASSTVA
jgi:hypothetical protein